MISRHTAGILRSALALYSESNSLHVRPSANQPTTWTKCRINVPEAAVAQQGAAKVVLDEEHERRHLDNLVGVAGNQRALEQAERQEDLSSTCAARGRGRIPIARCCRARSNGRARALVELLTKEPDNLDSAWQSEAGIHEARTRDRVFVHGGVGEDEGDGVVQEAGRRGAQRNCNVRLQINEGGVLTVILRAGGAGGAR
jgi:hypothetical protein